MLIVSQRRTREEFCHADNSIHGRADFVAHVGQKIALGTICSLSSFLCHAQLFVQRGAGLGVPGTLFGLLPSPFRISQCQILQMCLLIDCLNMPHHAHAAHQRRNMREDNVHVLHFTHEIVCTRFQRLQQYLAILLARQDQQPKLQVTTIRPRASPSADLEAIHLGHHDINDQDMKRFPLHQIQSRLTGEGGRHHETTAAKLLRQFRQVDATVVDCQQSSAAQEGAACFGVMIHGFHDDRRLEQPRHHRQQFLVRTFLGQESIRARIESRNMISFFLTGRQHHDRNDLQRHVTLQPSAYFQPGFVTQVLIEQHEIGCHLQTELNRLLGCRCMTHTVASIFQ